MSGTVLGAICGVVFGIVDVGLMLPIQFPPEKDKNLAMVGAFFSCFAVGVVIGAAKLPMSGWLAGILLALIVSLPSAIVTKSYIPILPVSAIGGAIIGFVVSRWGQ